MGGELSKREGVLLHSFQSEAGSFCCFFHRFTQIYALITISLLDIGFKWCFMISFFYFERVHLAIRGCTCALRGCSRTLKTPNSPPLLTSKRNMNFSPEKYMATGAQGTKTQNKKTPEIGTKPTCHGATEAT